MSSQGPSRGRQTWENGEAETDIGTCYGAERIRGLRMLTLKMEEEATSSGTPLESGKSKVVRPKLMLDFWPLEK